MIRDCQHSGLKTKEWLANHGISKDTLFLFCGKKNNRIKGLLWEGDGFLLLYKRLEVGAYSGP
jgi:transposase